MILYGLVSTFLWHVKLKTFNKFARLANEIKVIIKVGAVEKWRC